MNSHQERQFLSPAPEVRLHKAFTTPFNNAVATARTCYSGKGIVDDTQITPANHAIAESIYQAGHHTVLGHAHFQFALSGISRQFIWSFLHSHMYYNSEQVSQRYVEVKPDAVAIPPLNGQALAIYKETVEFQMQTYKELTQKLMPVVTSEYLKLFPHHARNLSDKKLQDKLLKRSLEVARYVLPVATTAYMYHTISGITLMRYYRLCNQYDSMLEQRIVVGRMVEELLKYDPLYEKILQEPLEIDVTPEFTAYVRYQPQMLEWHVKDFLQEFDASLDGKTSKLIDWKVNNEQSLADAVREVLGFTRNMMSNEQAIDAVLNPAQNKLLGESLNLTTLSKLGRALHHPAYTFRKKISHTGDSQDQRHRMTPASRPVLTSHMSSDPDYILPALIAIDPDISLYYDNAMHKIWENLQKVFKLSCNDEYAAYLLPNAVSIRFTESADLSALHHKHRMRLCYLAQEEIWRASVEEAQQVSAINPLIGKYLLPPCTQRHLAKTRPTCPEGDRFCGVKVWQIGVDQYERTI